jgi:hypothetical protein
MKDEIPCTEFLKKKHGQWIFDYLSSVFVLKPSMIDKGVFRSPNFVIDKNY